MRCYLTNSTTPIFPPIFIFMRKDVVSLAELRFTMHLPQPMTAEQFLRRHKGVSHRMLVRLKRLPNGICCNGRQIRTIDMVQFGDEIVLTDCEVPSALAPSAAAVPVLGETDSYIVYNKPAGMPVHPSQGHHGDTLGNVFAAQFPQLPFRPVYRLDSDTSGICLIAKSAYAGQHPKDLSGTGLRGTFHRRHGRCSHWQSRGFRAVPVCPSGGQARSDALHAAAERRHLHAAFPAAGNGTHPPDTGTHGISGVSSRRRPAVRHQFRTVSPPHAALRFAGISRSRNRRMPAVFSGVSVEFMRVNKTKRDCHEKWQSLFLKRK